jgi:hypothetical protein
MCHCDAICAAVFGKFEEQKSLARKAKTVPEDSPEADVSESDDLELFGKEVPTRASVILPVGCGSTDSAE